MNEIENSKLYNEYGMPLMLGIKETAKRSGLAEHHIRALCKEDTHRRISTKVGTKYLINMVSLNAYLFGQMTI